MSDFQLVDPTEYTLSLPSLYSAYIAHFSQHNLPWYDRSWSHLFLSLDSFLQFSWPAIVVADSTTGKAHIVTRPGALRAFVKMVKTRFGETLPELKEDTLVIVHPASTQPRPLRTISSLSEYRKLHLTLPAAELSVLRSRFRAGDSRAVKGVWGERSKTWVSLSWIWSERNSGSCLEFGWAGVRCGVLDG